MTVNCMTEITVLIPSTFVLSFNLVRYVFSRVWEFTRCLQFGIWVLPETYGFLCYSIACFCKLLYAVICVIVRHSLYEAYVTGQSHSTASVLANRTFRFIFLLQILLASAFCFLPFLIFSSLCLLKSFA